MGKQLDIYCIGELRSRECLTDNKLLIRHELILHVFGEKGMNNLLRRCLLKFYKYVCKQRWVSVQLVSLIYLICVDSQYLLLR